MVLNRHVKVSKHNLCHDVRKPVFGVFEPVIFKLVCLATETSSKVEFSFVNRLQCSPLMFANPKDKFSRFEAHFFVIEDCSFANIYQQYAFYNTDVTAKMHGWILKVLSEEVQLCRCFFSSFFSQ